FVADPPPALGYRRTRTAGRMHRAPGMRRPKRDSSEHSHLAPRTSTLAMILPLRRRHRRMFAVIGVLLPVAFVAGVAARKPIPTAALPAGLISAQATFSPSQWERLDLFTNTTVRVRLLRDASNTNRTAIQMSAPKGFVKADLLVYWLPANSTLKDTVP